MRKTTIIFAMTAIFLSSVTVGCTKKSDSVTNSSNNPPVTAQNNSNGSGTNTNNDNNPPVTAGGH